MTHDQAGKLINLLFYMKKSGGLHSISYRLKRERMASVADFLIKIDASPHDELAVRTICRCYCEHGIHRPAISYGSFLKKLIGFSSSKGDKLDDIDVITSTHLSSISHLLIRYALWGKNKGLGFNYYRFAHVIGNWDQVDENGRHWARQKVFSDSCRSLKSRKHVQNETQTKETTNG